MPDRRWMATRMIGGSRKSSGQWLVVSDQWKNEDEEAVDPYGNSIAVAVLSLDPSLSTQLLVSG